MEEKQCIKCCKTLSVEMFEKYEKRYRNVCFNCRLEQHHQRLKVKLEIPKIPVSEKTCAKCKLSLLSSEFNKYKHSADGLDKFCRKCCKLNRKKKQVNTLHITTLMCKVCNESKSSSEFRPTKKSSTGYFKTCNSCWKPIKWNKAKQKLSEKKYVAANKDKIKAKWKRDGMKINKRVRNRLNHRIVDALKACTLRKNNKTTNYVGCSIIYLKNGSNIYLKFQYLNYLGKT